MDMAGDVERGFLPDLGTRRFDWRHSHREFARSLRGRDSSWFVASAAGTCIGMLGVDLRRARHRLLVVRRHVYMHSLFVVSGWRRAGVARRLVRRGLAWALRRGARQVRLEMAVNNRGVRRFYESLGFRPRETMFTLDLRAVS